MIKKMSNIVNPFFVFLTQKLTESQKRLLVFLYDTQIVFFMYEETLLCMYFDTKEHNKTTMKMIDEKTRSLINELINLELAKVETVDNVKTVSLTSSGNLISKYLRKTNA